MNAEIRFFNGMNIINNPFFMNGVCGMLGELDKEEHEYLKEVIGPIELPESNVEYLQKMKDSVIVVLIDQGKAIGCSTFTLIDHPTMIEIKVGCVYIVPTRRREGLAKEMIEQTLKSISKTHTLDKPSVLTLKVFSENEGAVALYNSLGFNTHMLEMHKKI